MLSYNHAQTLAAQETLAEKAKSNEKQSAMLVISINERTKHRTMESSVLLTW